MATVNAQSATSRMYKIVPNELTSPERDLWGIFSPLGSRERWPEMQSDDYLDRGKEKKGQSPADCGIRLKLKPKSEISLSRRRLFNSRFLGGSIKKRRRVRQKKKKKEGEKNK